MAPLNGTPGPVAASAFKIGVLAAAIVGLAAVGFSYWYGLLNVVLLAYVLLLLFPVYLVLAASALSVWLGYGKDASDLRPVYREKGG